MQDNSVADINYKKT